MAEESLRYPKVIKVRCEGCGWSTDEDLSIWFATNEAALHKESCPVADVEMTGHGPLPT